MLNRFIINIIQIENNLDFSKLVLMKLKFLGTGTSQGVPIISSDHPVCLSDNLKDKRLRSSALITTDNNRKVLIDCGPDFRQQMLVNRERVI